MLATISTATAPAPLAMAPGPLLLKFNGGAATGAPVNVRAVDARMSSVLTTKLIDDIDRAITMIPSKRTSHNLRELSDLMRSFDRTSAAISALTASNGGNFREVAELNFKSSVADLFLQKFVQSLGLAVVQSALIDRANFVKSVPGLQQRLQRAKAALIGAQTPLTNAMLLSGTAYKRTLDDIQRDEAEESAHPCKSKPMLRMQAQNDTELELAKFMADNANAQQVEVDRGAIDLMDVSKDGHDGALLANVIDAMNNGPHDDDAEVVASGKP